MAALATVALFPRDPEDFSLSADGDGPLRSHDVLVAAGDRTEGDLNPVVSVRSREQPLYRLSKSSNRDVSNRNMAPACPRPVPGACRDPRWKRNPASRQEEHENCLAPEQGSALLRHWLFSLFLHMDAASRLALHTWLGSRHVCWTSDGYHEEHHHPDEGVHEHVGSSPRYNRERRRNESVPSRMEQHTEQ